MKIKKNLKKIFVEIIPMGKVIQKMEFYVESVINRDFSPIQI